MEFEDKLNNYKAIKSELASLTKSIDFYLKTATNETNNNVLWHIEKVIQKNYSAVEELFLVIEVDLPEAELEMNLNLIEDILASTDFTEEEVVNSLICELKQRI